MANREESGGTHHGQESLTPPKAEYTGADHTVFLDFSLGNSAGDHTN
jgi:hypothetical protein